MGGRGCPTVHSTGPGPQGKPPSGQWPQSSHGGPTGGPHPVCGLGDGEPTGRYHRISVNLDNLKVDIGR